MLRTLSSESREIKQELEAAGSPNKGVPVIYTHILGPISGAQENLIFRPPPTIRHYLFRAVVIEQSTYALSKNGLGEKEK